MNKLCRFDINKLASVVDGIVDVWYMSLEAFDVWFMVKGISTRNPGSVFKQNDITEVQIKNTLIPATICNDSIKDRGQNYTQILQSN